MDFHTDGLEITNAEAWGMVPLFLNTGVEGSAKEQIDTHYQMGWRPQDGFTVVETEEGISALYSGDPPISSIGTIKFRDETLYLLEHEYVAIKYDDKWEICRLD